VSHLRLFVGRRPFSSAATTIDVAPPLRGTRTAEMRLTTRKKKNRRAFSRLLLRQIFLVCWRVKGISRRAGDYRDLGHAHIRLPSDRLREDCRRPRPIVQVADQIRDSIVVTGTAVLPAIRTRARQLASVRETIFRRVPTLQYLGCVSKSTFVLLYSSERGFSGRGRPVCRSHTYPWDSSGSPGSYP
jgi:hypothetical protein